MSADADPLGAGLPAQSGRNLISCRMFFHQHNACLSHCRSPLAFVAQHWREGRLGALRIGLLHGSYCLGCCWALFAVLVAAGVMSPAWMLLLTLIVFVEKVLPKGQRISAAIGVWFVALGLAIAGGNLPPLEGL